MNIILEGNINFYDELHNMDNDSDDEDDNYCLITKMLLDKNSIKLPCNHAFNFVPLYKEVIQQKAKTNMSYLNTDKLAFNQIKCPYCRQKFDFLLPHIRLNKEMIFCQGVNTPEKLCMEFHTCEYMFKNGKNKNNLCAKPAYYGVVGCYCSSHHSVASKNNGLSSNSITTLNSEDIILCKAVLKSGKRVGQECGLKICNGTEAFCKRHSSK